MSKTYTLVRIDGGCGCCSYVPVAQFDSLQELYACWPDTDGYDIDVDDDEAGDD